MANFSKHSFTLQDALRLSNELEFVLENAGEL